MIMIYAKPFWKLICLKPYVYLSFISIYSELIISLIFNIILMTWSHNKSNSFLYARCKINA